MGDTVTASNTPIGGRPTEDRELRPQGRRTIRRLQEAAREVLGERGFHGMRVDDIVQRAEASHGTFYLYFANKQDLLTALMRQCMTDLEVLAGTLPSIADDESGRTALRSWLEDFDALYREQGPVIRAWLDADDVDGDWASGDAVGILRDAFASRIRTSPSEDIDPEAAALAVVAMIERVSFLRQDHDDRDRHLDTLATITHRGVFAA